MKNYSHSPVCKLLIAATWLMGFNSLCTASTGEHSPQLQLANGDFLAGMLLDSSASDVLVWQSTAFTEAFPFPAVVVAAAHFPGATTPAEVSGDFAAELVGGNLVIGKMLDITSEELVIDSSSLGKCRIAKNRIRRLVRWGEGSGITYLGPHGLEGWTPKTGQWEEVTGHLVTNKRGTVLLSECKIPAQACLEVEISWQSKPDFQLAIGVGENLALESFQNLVEGFNNFAFRGGQRRKPKPEPTSFPLLEFETYNSKLRMVAERKKEADIAPVADFNEGAGRVQLQVYVDSKKGNFAAYDREGKFLGEVHVFPETDSRVREGISLTNRTGDVRLERLVVRNWNGLEPPHVETDQEYVQTLDGSLAVVDSMRFDADLAEFVVEAKKVEPVNGRASDEEATNLQPKEPKQKPLRIPSANVVEISFPSKGKLSGRPLSFLLTSGERLTASLGSIADGKVTLICPGFESPVILELANIRSIVGPAQTPATAESEQPIGRLESDGISCHGVVTSVTTIDQTPTLSFRPKLSETSVPLLPKLSAKIVYRDPPVKSPKPMVRRENVQKRKNLAEQLMDVFTGKSNLPAVQASNRRNEDQLLWLREGDRIPCHLDRLDEEGIVFHTSLVEATSLPHKHLKVWEKRVGHPAPRIDAAKQERLLTLPRMQRSNPPLHLIESVQGDLLRARLLSMDDKNAIAEVRLNTKTLASSRIRRIIWLHPESSPTADESTTSNTEPYFGAEAFPTGSVQAICRDGVRLTYLPKQVADSVLSGTSRLLGDCRVKLGEVDHLLLGAAIADSAEELPFQDWKLSPATDPLFVQEDGQPGDPMNPGAQSPLIGLEAPDFHLKTLSGDVFRLGDRRGHLVVLDFWASWCGPCVQGMPLIENAVRQFVPEQVELIAVNLQEDAQTIEAALERMQISPQVLLDIDGAAAGKYAVTAIPQTVVINAEGKIAAVFIGGGRAAAAEMQNVLQQLLGDEPLENDKPAG
ncbi:TlpA family protein disulfide reductase [Bythopirellula polymerisocia]|uniref:Thiol-disulfide oxidoreductase ResA n=1 Tax=Bythopirellula polymerisocia TaxID=2528003 RepID=A0A5C6CR23_9BACT|nr:TlpA disulfide reductase family protein [Bythopirellula polymerisocia]TWU26014.1 Thiol-disulfide oxidoreductase ResA [Bythopirellula polymerisocia]